MSLMQAFLTSYLKMKSSRLTSDWVWSNRVREVKGQQVEINTINTINTYYEAQEMEIPATWPHETETQKHTLAGHSWAWERKEAEHPNLSSQRRDDLPHLPGTASQGWETILASHSGGLEAVCPSAPSNTSSSRPWTFTPGCIYNNSSLLHFITLGRGLHIYFTYIKAHPPDLGLEKWLILCTRLRFRRCFRSYTDKYVQIIIIAINIIDVHFIVIA